MRAVFVPSCLAILIASLSSTAAVASELEEVVVTASPLTKDRDAVNQAVATLSGNALHQAAAANLGETLASLPGVTSASFGPGVGLPVIRGQSDNRVKVMQDSIGTLDASTASPDHAVTLEPLFARRIEVLRGPAALRYGSGAVGGVVNVLDNRIPDRLPDELEGGVELRHATVNDGDTLVGTLTGALGSVALHWDGVTRDNDDLRIPGAAARDAEHPEDTTQGYIANTDAESESNSLGASYMGERGFIGLSVNRMKNNYGIPPGAHEHHDDEGAALDEHEEHEHEEEQVRIDMEQTRVDIKGELREPFAGAEKLTFRAGHNDYEHLELENGEPGTRFTNDAWEGRMELVHSPLAGWQGAFGLQAADRTFAAEGDESFIPRSDISNQGFFLVEETRYGPLLVEMGARAEEQRIAPRDGDEISHSITSLSAAATWHFTQQQRLSFSLARSQRAPSVEELLAKGPHPATGSYLIGDDQLEAETSQNLDIGYHWHSHRFDASVNAFYNRIDDFIYAQATGNEQDELEEYRYGQRDATFKGAEADVHLHFSDQWLLKLFADSVRATFDGASGAAADIPRIPPLRYGSSLEYTLDRWRLSLTGTHATAQDHPGINQGDTEAYTRLDANLSYRLDQGGLSYLVFLRGHNLTNETIRNATSFLRDQAPEGGRGVTVGLRINF